MKHDTTFRIASAEAKIQVQNKQLWCQANKKYQLNGKSYIKIISQDYERWVGYALDISSQWPRWPLKNAADGQASGQIEFNQFSGVEHLRIICANQNQNNFSRQKKVDLKTLTERQETAG